MGHKSCPPPTVRTAQGGGKEEVSPKPLTDAPEAAKGQGLGVLLVLGARLVRITITLVSHEALRDHPRDRGRRHQHGAAALDDAPKVEVGAIAGPLAHLRPHGRRHGRWARGVGGAVSTGHGSNNAGTLKAIDPPALFVSPQTRRARRSGPCAPPRTPPRRGRPSARPSSATQTPRRAP